MRGWHCGSGSKGSCNNTHIGFEICEDALTDAAYFGKVYAEAVGLVAYLCKLYSISPTYPHLICHSEGAAMGMASKHADIMHWFPRFGKSMDTFRSDVAAAMNGQTQEETPPAAEPETNVESEDGMTYKTLDDVPTWGKATIQKLMTKGLINGEGNDSDGNIIINVNDTMVRVLVINDRAGLYK
jgi:N-acetylmuramoyl-L-alanine amidase CwlA